MKKLLALVALFPLTALAQQFPAKLAPGTFELSGQTSLSFLSQSVDYKSGGTTQSGDTTNWNVTGFGLYYVAPNIGIGGQLSYNDMKIGLGGGNDLELSTFTLGPAAGIDFPVGPQVDLFGRAALLYASQELGAGGNTIKSSGFGFGLQAGVKYFPVKNLSLDGALAFQYLSLSGDSSPSVDVSSTGFGVNLGISVYFPTR